MKVPVCYWHECVSTPEFLYNPWNGHKCIFIIIVFHLYFIGGKSAGEVLSVCDVNWRELLKWAVPGLLYFCDNLIGFYILLHLSAVS